MKKIIALVLAMVLQVNSSHALMESTRCTVSGDSLDGEQAKGRNAWALKCYPDLKFEADADGNFMATDAKTGVTALGYPFFVQTDGVGNIVGYVQAPVDPAAPCWDTNIYKKSGFCIAGCFTPEQEILFADGYVAIKEAKEKDMSSILTYDGSVKGHPTFKISELVGYTVDAEEYNQPILIIKTASGGEIRVTPNHPLVDSRGYMITAETFKVGDSLVSFVGKNDVVQSIERVDYFGKVYNVNMGTHDISTNIIVAQGFLSGTVYFQNEGLEHLNRMVLRDSNLISDSLLK